MKPSLALPAIMTDAYGGHGGIAQYNHDFLGALAGAGTVLIDYGFAASSIRHLPTKGQASRERLRLVLKGPVTQSIACVA